jgi:hypothetical protein
VILVASFLELVQSLSWAMRAPVFRTFVLILTGWVFAARRTVTAMLMVTGVAGHRHHAAFHRLFSAARWSLDQLGLLIFRLIVPLLGSERVKLTLDDTLARKRGLKVFGAGMHHDPLLSTRKLAVLNWGHSWVVLAVVVRLPCCPKRVFSLPVLFRLYLNHKAADRWRRAHRSRPELAVELLHRLCASHAERRFHAFVDSTYGGETVLGHLPTNCDLTSRLPLDARLHEPPPQRRPGQSGRPRKRGARLPTPEQMLGQRARRVTHAIYGRQDRVRLVETVARWYGVPARPLRVVAVEPLSGGRTRQAFYSTRADQTGSAVITDYAERWSIEETNQAAKSHLGFEEPQGWSPLAVQRTAPIAMLLYSLIVVWFAREGHCLYRPLVRPWYPKKAQPSFADMLRTLQQESLSEWISKTPEPQRQLQNLLPPLVPAMKLAA